LQKQIFTLVAARPTFVYVVKYLGWQAGVIGYNSERGPHKDHSTKVWSQLAKLVSEEKILNDFFWSNFLFSSWLGAASSETILKGDHLSTINLAKFSPN
jgi:hypothetical protein